MVAHPLGERLRELATGAVVGEHLVATRALDRGREGPRTGHLDLEMPGVALQRLLEQVEVLGEKAAGAPLVDASSPARQSPTGRLEVRTEPGPCDDRQGPSRHRRRHAATGQLGQVREVRQLAHHQSHRLGDVGPGQGADAGREGHARARVRAVLVMVAEPTTRVPSYTTADWPGAIPCAASTSSTVTRSPRSRVVTTARCSAP